MALATRRRVAPSPSPMTGGEVNARRQLLGLSRARLAQLAQMSPYDLVDFEYGRRSLPDDRMQRLTTTLEILQNAYAEVQARVGIAALCGASRGGERRP